MNSWRAVLLYGRLRCRQFLLNIILFIFNLYCHADFNALLTMNRCFSCSWLVALVAFVRSGCEPELPRTVPVLNDTTAALSLLLNEKLLAENMPDFGALRMPGPLGDTIIFKTDSVIIRYLPDSLTGFHFKFLTEDEICNLATIYYADTIRFPNFLQLSRFEKRDRSYDISLQVTCVIPAHAIARRKGFTHRKGAPCIFGMLCGGGMGVTVFREHNTLKIIRASTWSD